MLTIKSQGERTHEEDITNVGLSDGVTPWLLSVRRYTGIVAMGKTILPICRVDDLPIWQLFYAEAMSYKHSRRFDENDDNDCKPLHDLIHCHNGASAR